MVTPMFALFVPLAVLALVLAFRPGVDRSPDGFARAQGLDLDDESRAFVTFHLARMRLHRRVGALVGFVAGIALQRAVPGGIPTALVSMLGGAVVGTSIAELARWFPPARQPRRVASLQPRSRTTYLSAESRWLERLMIALLALTGAAALWQYNNRRTAVSVLIGVGVVVLAANRIVGRRIAERAVVDGTNPRLAAADRAVRVASVDVLATLVASLTLCIVTWLVIAAAPVQDDVVVGGNRVLALPDGATHVSMTPGDTTIEISWRLHGTTASTVVPSPTELHAGAAFGFAPRHPMRNLLASIATLLTGSWAFGEWLRVSRIAFARTTGRRGRQAAVAA